MSLTVFRNVDRKSDRSGLQSRAPHFSDFPKLRGSQTTNDRIVSVQCRIDRRDPDCSAIASVALPPQSLQLRNTQLPPLKISAKPIRTASQMLQMKSGRRLRRNRHRNFLANLLTRSEQMSNYRIDAGKYSAKPGFFRHAHIVSRSQIPNKYFKPKSSTTCSLFLKSKTSVIPPPMLYSTARQYR